MSNGNRQYIEHAADVERQLRKAGRKPASNSRAVTEFILRVQAQLRSPLPRGARVLDFGCAAGATVTTLTDLGYDASGVDILEYWGKDRGLIGEEFNEPSDEIRRRLFAVDPDDGRLPFADGTFDLIISDQVLEHVFDLPPVFAEHVRILKPGCVAIHRFPKPTGLIEPHTKLPFTSLHRFDSYLALCAIAGVRNERQHGMGWRDTYQSNRNL
ncbi:MAG TPA: class I SAM-dependent methyltransferase, partial [Nevskiaceae bacterium]|nr:class I SAM-dependent methyltransferase [Nevskiaceae bacterium]